MQSNSVLDQHRKVLGILYLVFGGLWALAALVCLGALVAGALPAVSTRYERILIGLLGGAAVLLLLGMAVIGIIGGLGMLRRRAWSKMPVMVAGVLGLVHFPLGTALGIYTLWFWLQPNSGQLFLPQPSEPRGPEPRGPDLRRPLIT